MIEYAKTLGKERGGDAKTQGGRKDAKETQRRKGYHLN